MLPLAQARLTMIGESQDGGPETLFRRLESTDRSPASVGDAVNDLIIAAFEHADGDRDLLEQHLSYAVDQLAKARNTLLSSSY